MGLHPKQIAADVEIRGNVDLRDAPTFLVPQMATADLPDASTVNGMLVWDTTVSALRLACGSNWEIVAIVS